MIFQRDIRSLELADYEEAAQAYARALVAHAEVLAVFQFGQVKHPGISDIDMLVLLSDEARPIRMRSLNAYPHSSPQADFLYCHPPVAIQESLARDLRLLHTAENPRRLAGRDFEFRAVTRAELIAHTIDNMAGVRNALQQALRGWCTLRQAIQTLANGAYSLRSLATLMPGSSAIQAADDAGARRHELAARAVRSAGGADPSLDAAVVNAIEAQERALALHDQEFGRALVDEGYCRARATSGDDAGSVPYHHRAQFAWYAFVHGGEHAARRFGVEPAAVEDPEYRSTLTKKLHATRALQRFLRFTSIPVPGVDTTTLFGEHAGVPQRTVGWLRRRLAI